LAAVYYGFIAPFVVALVPLLAGLICCARWWLSDQPAKANEAGGFQKGLAAMDQNLWILGMTQSLFLGSMYTFVFLWTPALEDSNTPYGLIFSIFMVMISIGSGIFKRVTLVKERWPAIVLGSSALCFSVTALQIQNRPVVFGMFVLFETICGMMFPAYAGLRSKHVPEEHRTTIMNIYRIPLNLFVIIMLLNKKNMQLNTTFGICAAANFVALVLWKSFKTLQYELVDQEEDFGDLEE
jgi:MFS family permease